MIQSMQIMHQDIKVLAFDVFGTVVDWRSSVIAEGEQLGKAKGLQVDWTAFADAWRSIYRPYMDRVGTGKLPWTKLDDLHRQMLEETLSRFGIHSLSEDEKQHFNRVWHRLNAWPDSAPGLQRLKTRFVITTLSNGNISLLTNMAKHAGLPWDVNLSCELYRAYKPKPETYLGAAGLLGLRPAETMMVAAHYSDLRAARGCGLLTAYVNRPREFGDKPKNDLPADPKVDLVVDDFEELATKLGG